MNLKLLSHFIQLNGVEKNTVLALPHLLLCTASPTIISLKKEKFRFSTTTKKTKTFRLAKTQTVMVWKL